jgi:hypothetical protein
MLVNGRRLAIPGSDASHACRVPIAACICIPVAWRGRRRPPRCRKECHLRFHGRHCRRGGHQLLCTWPHRPGRIRLAIHGDLRRF